MPPDTLVDALDKSFIDLDTKVAAYQPTISLREVGEVIAVSVGIALVRGLPGVGYEELVKFPNGTLGIAFNVDADEVGIVLLGDYAGISAGDQVQRTYTVTDVPVGETLIGRVIDPLGEPLDGKQRPVTTERLEVERDAKPIMDRAAVDIPLLTGLKVIDALIPIGRGQRELILGDRQTGKTAIAVASILNQKSENVVCVYCSIGRRASAAAKVIAQLSEAGAMAYTVVIVAEGNDAPGLIYLAPYAATSIAEYFMEKGRDVLIIYDDLTQHARAYREISLLLRRPPGREAFPGDIFYIHSRLLERATHLTKELGGGSLTALPVIETDAQDISAYIPTNLISITDGQLYLSPSLFELEVLPAIDVAKSVSRVGSNAQSAAYKAVAGDLKLAYSQFEELESFSKFGTRLDPATQKAVDHGQRIRECLKQGELDPMTLAEQITVMLALAAGLFDTVPLTKMNDAQSAIRDTARKFAPDLIQRFSGGTDLTPDDRSLIQKSSTAALAPFQVPA